MSPSSPFRTAFRSVLALFTLVTIKIQLAIAAQCYGTGPKPLSGAWVTPVDVIEGMCSGETEGSINCSNQPGTDCMLLATDEDNGVDLLFRRQWMGTDEPNYANCIGALNQILNQCFDNNNAETGEWVYGSERYQIYYTSTVGMDYSCYGTETDMTQQLANNPGFDYTQVNTVSQVVCLVETDQSFSYEVNAGTNWQVKGTRRGTGDTVDDDFSHCMQAMTRIMRMCLLSSRHYGGFLRDGSRSYELIALQATTRLVTVNGLGQDEFDSLVSRYRSQREGTFARRGPVDSEESSYYRPDSEYYAFQLTAPAYIFDGMASDPDVDSVAPLGILNSDGVMHMPRQASTSTPSPVMQSDSPDHLKTISWDGETMNYRDYEYDPRAGADVDVWIIDSGIVKDHPEFKDVNVMALTTDKKWGTGDTFGHGTAVASIIAGAKNGVAKKASIYSIKVFPTGGTMADARGVLDALDLIDLWTEEKREKTVVNMSLSWTKDDYTGQVIMKRVKALSKTGVIIVVSAGNSNVDACSKSPAALGKTGEVITVGATEPFGGGVWYESKSMGSNHGECVNIWATGYNVDVADLKYPTNIEFRSLWSSIFGSSTASTGYTTKTGTSFAAPAVAGMVAYEMSRTEFKFKGALVSSFVDYFHQTAIHLDLGQGLGYGLRINNKAGQDTCEDRFGVGFCPR